MRTACVTIVLAISISLAYGQGILTFSGVVTDANTGKKIAGALVSLAGGSGAKEEVTDSDGVFVLTLSHDVKAGDTVRLRVRKDGYEAFDENVTVGQSLPHPVALVPKTTKGKPTRVSPARPKPQTATLRGFVSEKGSGQAVTATQVWIMGEPYTGTTDDRGRFTISNIAKPYGSDVTLGVDAPWVIEEPYYLGYRGRTYFPNPGAQPLAVYVRRYGDQGFLQGPSLEKMLGQKPFHFEDRSTVPADDEYGWNGAIDPQEQPHMVPAQPSVGSAQITAVASHDMSVIAYDSQTEWQRENNEKEWNVFLKERAEEIGLPVSQLVKAIDNWVRDLKNDYQRGLANLYLGDYRSATIKFHQALNGSDAPIEQLYMSVAYAEYRNGNYDESSVFLRKLSDLHPDDPLPRNNLSIVQRASAVQNQKREQVPQPVPQYEFPSAPSSREAAPEDRGPQKSPTQACKNNGKFESACNPFGTATMVHAIDNTCAISGDAASPGDQAQDRQKNNLCAKGPARVITIKDLTALQQAVDAAGVDYGAELGSKLHAGPPSDRSSLFTKLPSSSPREGDLVSFVGYIVDARSGSLETVNCDCGKPDQTDVQIVVADHPLNLQAKPTSVADRDTELCSNSFIAETIPHRRPAALELAAIEPLRYKKAIVKITGQLFFDASHRPCYGSAHTKADPSRLTVFEIHPVYDIEVCSQNTMTQCTSDSKEWKSVMPK